MGHNWSTFWRLVFYRWMYRRGKRPYNEGRIGRFLRLFFRHMVTKTLASIVSGMIVGQGIITSEPAYVAGGVGLFVLVIIGSWRGYVHNEYPHCCEYAAFIDERAIHRNMSPARVIDEHVQADVARIDSVRSEPER